MQEEAWSRLLDSDATPEQYAKEISSGFLAFVKEESAALDAGRLSKVIISLLHLKDDQLESLKDDVIGFCEACQKEEEDWVKVVASIVLRWLKRVPKDNPDFFAESEKRIIEKVKNSERRSENKPPSQEETAEIKFTLPGDVIPTHWPFLATEALPKLFDISTSESNQHFTPKSRPKKIKMTIRTESTTVVPPPAEPTDPMSYLPEKARELISQNSNLLTEENKQVLIRFFRTPADCGIASEREIPIGETRTVMPDNPLKTEILTVVIKLTPEPKWQVVKKKKYAVRKA